MSEQRIRNYRVSARVSAEEKQVMHDLVKKLGFKSEGDLVRSVFFGTTPFQRPQPKQKYLVGVSFAVHLLVGLTGDVIREVKIR